MLEVASLLSIGYGGFELPLCRFFVGVVNGG